MNQIRIQFNYGTIAGLLTFAAFLLSYFIGINPLGAIKLISLAFPVLFILQGVRKVRDVELNGYMTFRKGLAVGWFISLVYASMYAMLVYLFGVLISDGFFYMHIEESIAMFEASREVLGEERINTWIAETNEHTLSSVAFGDFNSKMAAGILISLIIAGVLKRNLPENPPATEEPTVSE